MAAIVDEIGHDVPYGNGGILVIKRPWPAMIHTIWGDPERFRKGDFPEELGGKLYLAGDVSIREQLGQARWRGGARSRGAPRRYLKRAGLPGTHPP